MATKTSPRKDVGSGDAVPRDDVALPDGWTLRMSRTRNRHYFYNDVTKVSTWLHPCATYSPSRSAGKIASNSGGSSDNGDFQQHHAQRSTSHENPRTPAQSRLNHLQRELRDQQKQKDAAQQPGPSARKMPTSKSTKRTTSSQQTAEQKSPIKRSRLNDADQQIASPIKPARLSDADQHAAGRSPHCWFDAHNSCTQRQQPTTSETSNSPAFAFTAADQRLPTKSMFGNIFSFAKSVVQSMASPFHSAETPMQIDSEMAASAADPATASLTQNRSPPASAVHPFNGEQRKRPLIAVRSPPVRATSSATSPVTAAVVSSPRTPANNRLHALRHKLVQDQQTTAVADDIIMTDDDDCTDDDDDNASVTDDESSPMDWDECIEQAGAAVGRPIGRIVVIDTNVLISDLALVQRIVAAQRPDSPNRTQFAVPYIVLKELDGLKMRSRDGTGRQAQRAIKALHEAIKASDWRLQVERPARTDRKPLLEITTNDDRILNCALELRGGEAVTAVHVLSNDVNLRNFAMLHGLRSQSVEEFRNEWK